MPQLYYKQKGDSVRGKINNAIISKNHDANYMYIDDDINAAKVGISRVEIFINDAYADLLTAHHHE